MNIIWDKWVIEQLPRVLRTNLMYIICMIFTGPVRQLYTDFIQWKKRMLIKAGGSPQVCMLEKIVKDSLDIDIRITEGNGKPIDFIINAEFMDLDKERQLFALLDRYKLAGKSYGYENAGIAITAQWTGFVCELANIGCVWSGAICEKYSRLANVITAKFYPEYISAEIGYRYRKIVITSTYPTASNITYSFEEKSNGEVLVKAYNLQLPKGFTGELIFEYPEVDIPVSNYIRNEELSITEDQEYDYSLSRKMMTS